MRVEEVIIVGAETRVALSWLPIFASLHPILLDGFHVLGGVVGERGELRAVEGLLLVDVFFDDALGKTKGMAGLSLMVMVRPNLSY